MGKKVIIGTFLAISFISLNIFSRFLYSQSWFGNTSFTKELDPFDIISLVVNVLVTISIGWYFSKIITEQRYEKEYLINDLKQIEEELKFIEKSMQGSQIDLQSILTFLIKLKIYIDRFGKTIEVFGITKIKIEDLDNQYSKLYHKTTNIESNHLVLDDSVKNEIDIICSDFILKTRQMIFKINNH